MYNDIKTQYYEDIIVPYYDYIQEKQKGNFGRSNDLKKAINCASKMYHLREHLPNNPSYNEILNLCPEYKIIQDVTNTSKHKILTRRNPNISNVAQISELIIIENFKDNKGDYSNSDKVVQVTKDDGTKLFLHDILYKMICFWDKYLYDNGFIDKQYNPKAPNQIGENKSREECKKLDLEVIEGMDFKMNTQMMKWNYEKGKAIPIDLTGTKVQFNVYKPKLTPQIQRINNKTKEISTLDINLTSEDLVKFNLFKTDEERLSFIEKLDYVQEQVANHFKELNR